MSELEVFEVEILQGRATPRLGDDTRILVIFLHIKINEAWTVLLLFERCSLFSIINRKVNFPPCGIGS